MEQEKHLADEKGEELMDPDDPKLNQGHLLALEKVLEPMASRKRKGSNKPSKAGVPGKDG